MRRVFKKGIAVALAAAMVVTLAPASADAAKKPALSKKSVSVKVGKTTTIKLKNGAKSAKVTWKSSKKKIAKITKSSKTSAKIKGVKKGKSVITASYKVGKKVTKLKCKVTVKAKTTTTVTTSNAPAATTVPAKTSATPVPGNTTPAPGKQTDVPATATPKVTGTPTASPTPSPVPKNTETLKAYKIGAGKQITIDGDASDETWKDSETKNLILDKEATKVEQIRGEIKTTAATAKLMWADDAAYIFMDVTKADVSDKDSVTIYFDENDKASKDTAIAPITVKADGTAKADNKYDAVSKKTATGFVVEAKINVSKAKEVGSNFCIDLQISEEKGTLNFYDTRSTMVYDKDKDTWSLGDETVAVAEKPELMGQVVLADVMPPQTKALYATNGADIRTAAKLDDASTKWDSELADGETEPAIKSKSMTFVDPKLWKDVYEANGEESIYFSNVNIPGYKGSAPNIKLGKPVLDENGDPIPLLDADGNAVLDEESQPVYQYYTDRSMAEGYILWDEDYLYVLFNITDDDISPANEDHYTTDSTEFFLDEDFSRPNAFVTDGTSDEVQFRVDAMNNAFSANDAGTGNYKLVAHAAKTTGTGYVTEYIIKLNNKHTSGDMMGMDLQVNDCFTVPGTPADPDAGTEATEDSADRAATLTAYDTTNNAYQDPSCFGRVELVKKDAGSDNPGTDDPGTEANVFTVPLTNRSVPGWGTTATHKLNDDGSVTIDWAEAASGYTSVRFSFDAPANLEDYKYVVVDTANAETLNFNVEDAVRKAETEQMTQTLALDQAQVVKVQEINLKFAKQDSVRFAEMRAGGQQMDREKMMETMRATQEAKTKELNEVLTDDQKAKYTKFQEERRQRGFGGGQGNRQGPRNGQQ